MVGLGLEMDMDEGEWVMELDGWIRKVEGGVLIEWGLKWGGVGGGEIMLMEC